MRRGCGFDRFCSVLDQMQAIGLVTRGRRFETTDDVGSRRRSGTRSKPTAGYRHMGLKSMVRESVSHMAARNFGRAALAGAIQAKR